MVDEMDPKVTEETELGRDAANPYSHIADNYGPRRACFVTGHGATLLDDQGRSYIDFLGGIAVVSLGHSNPVINAALKKQSESLWHVSNYFHNQHAARLADLIDSKIASAVPGKVFFCNSGAEANEAAIKLARRFGGEKRYRIIAAEGGFHGRTMGALAATGQPSKQIPFAPMLDGFDHVRFGDSKAMRAAVTDQTVAVLLEPIQGEAGVIDPPEGYLEEVRAICDEHGLLMILDEVQSGLCRTGEWFAFQHTKAEPDVVLLAKALGNGIPIGAMWAKERVMASFIPGDHGTTFGGGALATAVGVAVIEEMDRLELNDVVRLTSKRLRSALMEMPLVKELSGKGLLVGVELERPVADEFVGLAMQRGLVVSKTSTTRLRLAPPLVITDSELQEGLAVFEEVASEFTHVNS